MRRLSWLAAGLVVFYGLSCGALYLWMKQPPETFARGISRVPFFVPMALQFRTLWASARSGSLAIGDTAPDFDLETLDRSSRVRLSAYRGSRPVVLIFGSYT